MTDIHGSPSRPGPEAELVHQFLEISLDSIDNEMCRTVFIEPILESARPDIVVVDWDVSTTMSWPEERSHLKNYDLRLVQLLLREGTLSEQRLRFFFPRRLAMSLERLEQAQMIYRDGNLWSLESPQNIFAVRRLVTFEAKISAMSKALNQAHFNTWFASESYVLTDTRNPTNRIVSKARAKGIGLWLLPDRVSYGPYLSAQRYSLPRSYASWIFNELAWKSSKGVVDGSRSVA